MLDRNHVLLPSAIFDITQDISARHSEIMNVGYKVALSKGIAWILIRAKYEVDKYPKYLDDIVVETWPLKPGRVDIDRNTVIKSIKGETLVRISEKWVLVDIKTKRILPSRVLSELMNYYDEEKIFDEQIGKISDYDCNNFYPHQVLATQIDHNMHLNNTRYADMIYNSLMQYDESLINRTIKSFQIEFDKENKYNDKINIGITSISQDEKFAKIIKESGELSSKAYISFNK